MKRSRFFIPWCVGLLACLALAFSPALARAEYTNGYPEFEWNGQTFNNTQGEVYHWRISSGELELVKDDTETVARSWTPDSWKAYNSVTQDTTEAIGRATGAEADIVSGDTSVNTPTVQGASDGVSTATDARAAGTTLDTAEQTGLDLFGQAGGSLPLELGSTALGAVVLGPAAFKLGVDIGNGLDQLFGFQEWHPLGEKEAEEASEHGEVIVDHSKHAIKEHLPWGPDFSLPPGYYVHVLGTETDAYEKTEVRNTCKKAGECEETIVHGPVGSPVPPGFGNTIAHNWERLAGEHGGWIDTETFYKYKEPSTCEVPPLPSGGGEQELYEWQEQLDSKKFCAKPEGVPAPGLITPGIEHENEAHGLPAIPKTLPATLPKHPPSTIPSKRAHEIWEGTQPDKTIKEHTEEPKKKKEEEEERGIIILPFPGQNETAPHYKERIEGLGLTHVSEYTVGETAINPNVGPDGVADTAPPEGSRVSPETPVEIGANPTDAPPIGGEGHTPIGGPAEPGIKLPHIALLCTVFPFGVPCWLKKQLEAFSSSGAPPVWTIGPIEWSGTKIPKAEIHLSAIEPIMEIVRPFMLIFGGIGILFFFYKVFTGNSIGGGENPPGEVPEPQTYAEEQGSFIRNG
jgi:hypothetical protein